MRQAQALQDARNLSRQFQVYPPVHHRQKISTKLARFCRTTLADVNRSSVASAGECLLAKSNDKQKGAVAAPLLGR